jgi:hypothetical protein
MADDDDVDEVSRNHKDGDVAQQQTDTKSTAWCRPHNHWDGATMNSAAETTKQVTSQQETTTTEKTNDETSSDTAPQPSRTTGTMKCGPSTTAIPTGGNKRTAHHNASDHER